MQAKSRGRQRQEAIDWLNAERDRVLRSCVNERRGPSARERDVLEVIELAKLEIDGILDGRPIPEDGALTAEEAAAVEEIETALALVDSGQSTDGRGGLHFSASELARLRVEENRRQALSDILTDPVAVRRLLGR